MSTIDVEKLEKSLISNISRKSIAISEGLKHIDPNNQDEIDLIINISDALNDEMECLKKLYSERNKN